jgi:hypothetical protein
MPGVLWPGTLPLPLVFYRGNSLSAMKLRERYRQLQDSAVVKAMVVRSVYASMALENQTVSLNRVEALYEQTGPTRPADATGR